MFLMSNVIPVGHVTPTVSVFLGYSRCQYLNLAVTALFVFPIIYCISLPFGFTYIFDDVHL